MAVRTGNAQRFEGKVVVVTGGANGIGLAITEAFIAEGAQVVIADINREAAERARDDILAAGGRAICLISDVSIEAEVCAMVQDAVARCGRIDILVNNAGVILHKLIVDLELEEWNRQLGVQLTGPFLVSKHVGRHMIERGGPGKMVNISSIAAVMGRVRNGAHCVSKAGLTLLTKVLAMELAEYKINVNVLAPGLIDVPIQRREDATSKAYKDSYLGMVPLGRLGEPVEIARAVLFLASSDADFITGQLFMADGGLMAGHYSLAKKTDFSLLHGHT